MLDLRLNKQYKTKNKNILLKDKSIPLFYNINNNLQETDNIDNNKII